MTEYIFLFFISLLGFTKIAQRKVFIYFILFVMCMFIALRGITVGTDTSGYSETFRYLTLNPDSWAYVVIFDPGFAVLCYYFKTFISSDPLDCWGVMGAFYVFSFYFFAKKYSGNAGLALVLFVMYDSYFIGFNIIRQCFALSCLMIVFTFFDLRQLCVKSRIFTFLLVALIAYMFHQTMFIFCLIPIISSPFFMKFVNKKILLAIIVGSFFVNVSGLAVNYAISFLDSTGIEGKLINYMSHVYREESGYSIVKLVIINGLLMFAIIVANDVKNIFLLTGILGIIVLNLLGPVVIEFVRVYESLMVFCLIFYTQLSCKGRYVAISKTYYPVLVCTMIVLCMNYIIKGYGEIVPYVFR